MSVSGPSGRKPRQVAGPGVDDDRDTTPGVGDDPKLAHETTADGPPDETVASTEPEPGRSVFDAGPEGEPATVETVPAPDPEREIDEDPVFRDGISTDVADVPPTVTTEAGDHDEPPVPGAAGPDLDGGLVGDIGDLRLRWEAVQASFVDDPRGAVEHADEMVSLAVADLQARIEQHREDLAETWRAREQPSTDDLLVAFQRYRDLFDGVLSL